MAYRKRKAYARKKSTANKYFRRYKGRGKYQVRSPYRAKRALFFKKRATKKSSSSWSTMKKVALAGAAAAAGYIGYKLWAGPSSSYNVVGPAPVIAGGSSWAPMPGVYEPLPMVISDDISVD